MIKRSVSVRQRLGSHHKCILIQLFHFLSNAGAKLLVEMTKKYFFLIFLLFSVSISAQETDNHVNRDVETISPEGVLPEVSQNVPAQANEPPGLPSSPTNANYGKI